MHLWDEDQNHNLREKLFSLDILTAFNSNLKSTDSPQHPRPITSPSSMKQAALVWTSTYRNHAKAAMMGDATCLLTCDGGREHVRANPKAKDKEWQ